MSVDSSGFNYVRRRYYISEVDELRKSLRSKLPNYISTTSTIYVGKGIPARHLGRIREWYVNINNGVIFVKTLNWGWRSLAKVIGGWEETRFIYSYSEDKPDKPTRDINRGWSTKPLQKLKDSNRHIWFSTARYTDGLRTSAWTEPAIFVRSGRFQTNYQTKTPPKPESVNVGDTWTELSTGSEFRLTEYEYRTPFSLAFDETFILQPIRYWVETTSPVKPVFLQTFTNSFDETFDRDPNTYDSILSFSTSFDWTFQKTDEVQEATLWDDTFDISFGDGHSTFDYTFSIIFK